MSGHWYLIGFVFGVASTLIIEHLWIPWLRARYGRSHAR